MESAMARARNIKPSFFTNEDLGTEEPIVGLLFIGLWCLADRDGRLEDRPLRIKAELFPYRESLDCNGYLTVLERLGFILRYEADGIRLIQVVNFARHQSPHNTEKSKGYPPPPMKTQDKSGLTVTQPLRNGEITEPKRPDLLIPDSLNHERGREDSKTLSPLLEDVNFSAMWKRWKAHRLQKMKPLNSIEEETQLMKLARFGAEEATEIVEYTIGRGALNLIDNGDHKNKTKKEFTY